MTGATILPTLTRPRLGLVLPRESGVRSDAAPLLLSSSVPPLRGLGTVWLSTLSKCSYRRTAFARVVDDSAPLSPGRQELERGTAAGEHNHTQCRHRVTLNGLTSLQIEKGTRSPRSGQQMTKIPVIILPNTGWFDSQDNTSPPCARIHTSLPVGQGQLETITMNKIVFKFRQIVEEVVQDIVVRWNETNELANRARVGFQTVRACDMQSNRGAR